MAAILFGLEKALEDMLHRISEKYEIDYNELHQFVMVPTEADESSTFEDPPAGGVKAKPKAKAKGDDRPQCKGLTAKKTQCKKFALAGGEFCACHQKKADEGGDPSEAKPKAKPKATGKGGKGIARKEVVESDGESEVVSPVRKGKKRVVKETPVTSPIKSPTPMAPKKAKRHTHAMDDEDHEGCDECTEHGNAGMMASPMYRVAQTAASRLRNILAQVNTEESGSDTDDE